MANVCVLALSVMARVEFTCGIKLDMRMQKPINHLWGHVFRLCLITGFNPPYSYAIRFKVQKVARIAFTRIILLLWLTYRGQVGVVASSRSFGESDWS